MNKKKSKHHQNFSECTIYISNVPNGMDANDFFLSYGKYGEILRIKMLKQYYQSEKYTDLEEYFGGVAILLFADHESLTKCLEDQKDHPFIINENVLFSETDNKNISNYFKRCGFLFFSSPYITNDKINQIFGLSEEEDEDQNQANPIQSIEILYPVELHKPGMAIIEFSTEKERKAASKYFKSIESIIEKVRNSNSKSKKNPNDVDYSSLLAQENKNTKHKFNFDVNFIIKHILVHQEEFSFVLPSPVFEQPRFFTSHDDDNDDDDDEEFIPSIIHAPDRSLCNNQLQFQRWFDFEIEFREVSFRVNSLLASQFSAKIKNQLAQNDVKYTNSNHGGYDRYSYQMEVDIDGDFQLVADSLMGQRICITAENAIFLLLCSRELKMEQLNSAVCQLVSDLTDIDSVIRFCGDLWIAKSKNQSVFLHEERDEQIDIYTEFFAENFFKLCELAAFKALPIDVICKTLDILVYAKKDANENDKNLSDWILEYFERNDAARVRLIPYMSRFLKQLNRAQLTSILSKPGANMNSLRESISQLISQLKISNVNDNNNEDDMVPIINDDEEDSHYCAYDENSPTSSGIFAYIRQKFGSVSEIVDITSSDSFQSILDSQITDQYYSSPPIENMWIQFDFKKHPFIIQAYTLRSLDKGNCPYLKNWVIEGSNTGGDISNWTELDRNENSKFLGQFPFYKTFHVTNKINETFRFIRLRKINSESNTAEQLVLKTIEFYGTLVDEDEKKANILYIDGKEWFGIFNYLMKKYHQNPANKEVQITSAADPHNLVNPEWSESHNLWKSSSNSNRYIKFNFNGKIDNEIGGHKIKTSVEKYLLKTSAAPSYPRSWAVEGSNDGVNWTIIDDVKNNTRISGHWKSYVFSCSNQPAASVPFSQIRIRLTGPNSQKNNVFYLSYVELYGNVTIEKS